MEYIKAYQSDTFKRIYHSAKKQRQIMPIGNISPLMNRW